MKQFKKGLSLLIVMAILMSMSVIMANASENVITIGARTNVADFETTSGFNSDSPEDPEEWAHGNGYIIRYGSFIKYSLPNDLQKGTYLLTAEIANYKQTALRVIVNEGTAKEYASAPDIVPASTNPETGDADGSMQFFTERTIGKVVLGGDNNTLTFKCYAHDNNTNWYPFVLKSFKLTYVSSQEVYEVHYSVPTKYAHTAGYTINETIASGTGILPEVVTFRGAADNYYTYDVSFLPQGIYSVGIEGAGKNSFTVDMYKGSAVDNVTTKAASSVQIPASGGWNMLSESDALCEISIGASDKYIKIDPVSTSGAYQTYALVFTKISKKTFDTKRSDLADYSHAGTNALIGSVVSSNILNDKVLTLRSDAGNYYTFEIGGIIEEGTYKVYASYVSKNTFKFDLSSGTEKTSVTNSLASNLSLPANGDWNSTECLLSDELATVYLDGNTKYLKITPLSGVTQLEKLHFVKVSDVDISEYVIPYNELISNEVNVGFYAGTDKTALESGIEGATDMAAIRGGNGYWVKYDISDIPAGTYTLSLNAASYVGTTAVDISVNDEVVLDDANIYSSNSYSAANMKVAKKVAVGTITIPELTADNVQNTLTLKGVKDTFNLKSIILSKGPAVNVLYERGTTLVKTLTDTVAEGTMYFDAYPGVEFEGKTTLVIFAVYKTKNGEDISSLDKVYTEVTDADKISGHVENITFEEGYTYTQKVFIWDNATLQGYSFK